MLTEENFVFPRILNPSQNSHVISRDLMRVPAMRNWKAVGHHGTPWKTEICL
jgi:hypothetical protein